MTNVKEFLDDDEETLQMAYAASEKVFALSGFDECIHRSLFQKNIETDKKKAPTIADIDGMEGHQFEYWCADLLKKNGFSDVKVTPGSNDQGVDILATKEEIKYAFQCKNYSSAVGNTPVQEIHAGKEFYKCHIGVVMTNNYFTKSAKELASETGVLLWDRDKLSLLLQES